MTNFQRSYSKVWWGNDNSNSMPVSVGPHQSYYYPNAIGQLNNIAEEVSDSMHAYQSSNVRRSLRSHDSGFNDSDHSPNTTSSSSQISANNVDNQSPKHNRNQHNLSPEQCTGDNISPSTDRSPSICSETMKTPPTVIRKKLSTLLFSPTARRISFSAPSSPDANNADETTKINNAFQSLDSFTRNMTNEQSKSRSNDSSLNNSRARSSSLRRGKTISQSNNSSYWRRANRRRLLDCVSQVSGSFGDVYTLAAESKSEEKCEVHEYDIHHSYESLTEVNLLRKQVQEETVSSKYNNETVTFGCGDDSSRSIEEPPKAHREKLQLPTYDELYPPNGSSTPKVTKAKKNRTTKTLQSFDHTQSSTTAIISTSQSGAEQIQNPNREFFDLEFDLSLTATMNWETCTYIEYTNPFLNGHASSVQFWLDETRSTYCHEILSTLQTKSILFEAARLLKLNPAIASKLIHQIQLKAIAIETKFEEVERVFESHAKLMKRLQSSSESYSNSGDDIDVANNKFKEKISVLMKNLTASVCQFMSKLNSKIIFQKTRGVRNGDELKKFERNVRAVIEMCQDLRVACETKIDDIEINVLLKELHSLKRSVLKTIRKVFQRLVNIIVVRIEENSHELLLRANINMIATLPAEGVYNSSERFSSLTDAFLASNIVRVLLMICLDSAQTSIRALSLRALATICSTPEMIHQYLEIGGLDVVTDILTDEKRNEIKFEPELREAVSVLTQVTAPWHHDNGSNLDDLLKLSIDNLVTRLSVLLEVTECAQTLMLCAACLNNLTRKSTLTFYSLMDNRTIQRLIQACDKHQQRTIDVDFNGSAIFLYEQITNMLFNMAGNKKCHQHLAHKEIIYFITFIFQTQFHIKYSTWSERTALKKTIKNILHIFARLIHHSAVGHEILEHNVVPIFSRVEQNLCVDNAYAKDLMYINKKLNCSLTLSPIAATSSKRARLLTIVSTKSVANYAHIQQRNENATENKEFDYNNNNSSGIGGNSNDNNNMNSNNSTRVKNNNNNNNQQLSLSNVTGSSLLESYV